MTNPLISSESARALQRLADGLQAYQQISGKLSAAILVQKGGQLIYGNQNPRFGPTFPGLAQLFFQTVPDSGSIWQAARDRGFRLGRRSLGRGALSPRAVARARELMGSSQTIIASTDQDGRGLKFVRRGARKARVHYRWGRKSYLISGDFVGPLPQGEKRLNFRAVATYFELMKREQGRRFLGASWLHKRWRKRAKEGFVPEGTPGLAPGWGRSRQFGGTERLLVNNNPRSQVNPLGTAGLEGSEASGNLAVRISSFVPGVRQVGEGRGIFVRAVDGVRADLDRYMERKHAELLEQAMKLGVAVQQ